MNGRRLLTVPGYFVAWLLWTSTAPIWLVAAAVTDLLRKNRGISLRSGAFATRVTAAEQSVWRMPDEMSFEDGAAFTHVFLTAYHALHTLARAKEGEWAVVTAAAGGVGTALIQLARVMKLQVIAGVGSSEKLDILAELGVEVTPIR